MKTVLISLLLVLLTGCAITPPMTETQNGAARVSATTSTPVVDGTSVTVVVVDFQEIDPLTGENAGTWKRSMHIYEAVPTGKASIQAMAATVPQALIQAQAAKDVAETGKCEGNCGTSILVQGAQALAESNAVSESATDVSGSLGTCTDCGAIPID